MDSIYPSSFESKVGFDRIREHVAGLCLCPLGRRNAQQVQFISDYQTVVRLVDETSEMKTILLMEDGFPVDGYVDATPFLERIKREGTYLDETELVNLRRSLDAIRALLAFFKKGDEPKYPRLTDLAKPVAYFPYVSDRIDAIINKFGKVKDNASPELAQIRSSISSIQNSISKRITSILKSAQSEGIVESDASPSIRDGRIVIPVLAANKRKLKGLVLDESATGKTVFIEPVEVVEMNNELRDLEYQERREVIRILVEFADSIRPYLPDLLLSYEFLGIIDFIRAKALFALNVAGNKPIVNSKAGISLRNAVHPLLMLALKKEGKSVVPLTLELNDKNHLLLISGPNAGGKSVCLKTTGLAQYMLQCGFLPPVTENSEMGIFNKIFIDIGDEQSIENDLSTYSSHLLNMKHFLRYADSKTMVLIDEFGSGTEPVAGGAIAEAILGKLNEAGTFGIITTHYSNLKHFASNSDGIINGAMLFDNVKIEPLFRLEVGKPGSSFAFEIARKIGLPEDLLQVASSKTGDDYVTFEKHLRVISRDKRYWEQKREKIRLTDKRLEEMEQKLASELSALKTKKQEVVQQAKQEAQALLAETNRRIENTIREIREAEAEKERTRELRSNLEQFKEEVKQQLADGASDEEIERKMAQIKDRQKRRDERKAKTGEVDAKPSKKGAPVQDDEDKPLAPGDKVKLAGQDIPGEVVSVGPNTAVVGFGQMLTTVQLDKLQRISSNEYRKSNREVRQPRTSSTYDMHKKRLNFKSDIDIRGYRADDAMLEVQELLDEALMLGISQVRILHGKGNGILRQLIREYLQTLPFVSSFADERVDLGGAGITVVKLD